MNQDLKESSLNAMKIVIATMPVMMLAMNITTLAVVWYGGNIIIAGDMPVGNPVSYTHLGALFAFPEGNVRAKENVNREENSGLNGAGTKTGL